MTLCSSKTAKGPFGFIATIREGREREKEKTRDGREREERKEREMPEKKEGGNCGSLFGLST